MTAQLSIRNALKINNTFFTSWFVFVGNMQHAKTNPTVWVNYWWFQSGGFSYNDYGANRKYFICRIQESTVSWDMA